MIDGQGTRPLGPRRSQPLAKALLMTRLDSMRIDMRLWRSYNESANTLWIALKEAF